MIVLGIVYEIIYNKHDNKTPIKMNMIKDGLGMLNFIPKS